MVVKIHTQALNGKNKLVDPLTPDEMRYVESNPKLEPRNLEDDSILSSKDAEEEEEENPLI